MLLFLLLHLLTFSTAEDEACPSGWRHFGDSCYFFSKHPEPWSLAAFTCKSLENDSYLVEVETEDESDYLSHIAYNKVYLGCFNDGYERTLGGTFLDLEATMTNEECIAFCRSKGYLYSGTQYRRQCFCGDVFNHHWRTTDSHCFLKCVGDEHDICGGHWRISVYNTAGRRYWLGGTDMVQEGKWKWFTSKNEFNFTSWMNGTENNEFSRDFGRNSEDCLNLDPTKEDVFQWNDENCQDPHYFICEKTAKKHEDDGVVLTSFSQDDKHISEPNPQE